MLGYILLLSVEISKSTVETGYKTDLSLSYCNGFNDSQIISGDRGAAENVFLGYSVRSFTPKYVAKITIAEAMIQLTISSGPIHSFSKKKEASDATALETI